VPPNQQILFDEKIYSVYTGKTPISLQPFLVALCHEHRGLRTAEKGFV
jgi:hypothetical protein